MRTYGGYIGFYPDMDGAGWTFGEDQPLMSSGRACLAKILRFTRTRRLHLPDHICDSVVLPLRGLDVEAVFYAIDEQLCPVGIPEVADGDMVLLVDYFGVRSQEVARIAVRYGDKAIVDRSQFGLQALHQWAIVGHLAPLPNALQQGHVFFERRQIGPGHQSRRTGSFGHGHLRHGSLSPFDRRDFIARPDKRSHAGSVSVRN